MRILYFFIILLFASCKTTFQRVPINSISEKEREKVYDFGKRILETCETRKFVPLTEKEVTKGLSKLSLQEMQYACDVLNNRNGKFISMKLIEVIDDTFIGNTKIFRFKGNFERNEFVNEIRIWLGTDGKFHGIIWKEWKDEYTPHKK